MQLTPSERDRLLLFTAAELARSRRVRGLLLNAPEATALVADAVAEAARGGARLAEALTAGRSILDASELLPGVVEVVGDVRIEAVFDDGTRLAVVTEPFGPSSASNSGPGGIVPNDDPRPGEYADVLTVQVLNTADVPISVTSHFHFFESNPRLSFDRRAAYGRHLAVAAGTALRFDPGTTTLAPLTPIGGARVVIGFAGLVDGPLDAPGAFEAALHRARSCGYLGAGQAPE